MSRSQISVAVYGLLLLLFAQPLLATEYIGQVVGVSDGDTVRVLDTSKTLHKVRLSGIDAPEKHQQYGSAAKQNLASWVFGKTVTVETNKLDRYKREVGKLLLNGVDVNLEQLRSGFGWHYKQYEREQTEADRRLYADAENAARKQRIGLWADAKPVPPWDFRHTKK